MSKERKKIILNVDDMKAGRDATSRILKRAGFEVWESASGKEALETLKNSPDLVVLDVKLPDMSGFEVCKRIKSDPAMKSIPVIHLSATYTTPKDRVSALDYGADGYLVQPVEPDELVAHINALLRLKNAEQELQAANRLYALLSDINQAIVRIKERQELFQAVCKIAVETGKFLMAWVGLIDEESGAVRPAASYGDKDGYLKQLSLNIKAERPPGIPTITAIQNGKVTTVNDIETDSRTQPWRLSELQRGYRSLAMIPLRLRGKLQGNLVIYADKPGFFTDQEVKLLEEIGVDISYALEIIEAEKERKRTEEKLRESEEKFSTAFQSSPAIVAITTIKEGKYVEVNDSYIYSTGYTRDELIGRPTAEINIWANADERIRMLKILKEKGRIIKEEFDFRVKSGEIRTWLFSAEPVNITGEPCLIGIAVDITEHQRAEEALRQSEAKYASLVEKGNDGIIIVENGIIQFVNTKMTEITGFARDEALGRKFADFFLPEESTAYLERHLKRMSGENVPEIYETTIVSRDGHSIPVEINASITVHQGRRAVMAIIRDITRRKKSQEALMVSETRYRRLFEAAKDGILILDAETGVIVDVNPFLEKMLGYSNKEFIGVKIWELGFLKDILVNQAHFAELQSKGYIIYEDLPLETADGRKMHVEFVSNVYAVDHQRVIQCNIRDITERKLAEEMLRQSIERFKQITESADEWIWEVDAKGIYSYCSPAVERILGYTPDELVGKRHFYDFFSPEVREELEEAALAAFEKKQSFKKLINPNIHKNGKTVVLETNGSPVLDENGNLLGYRGADTDITERRQREATLEEEAIRRRILIDQSRDGIVVLDYDGKVYETNQQFAKMLGYSAEEVRQLRVWDWEYQFTRERLLEMIHSVDEKGDHFETRHRRKDGTIYDVEISTNGATFAGQKLIFCVCRDITERKKAEEQLRYQANLVDNVSDAIFSRDMNFKILSWNKAAERMYGWKAEEVIGKDIREIFSIDFLNNDAGTIEKELRERGYWRYEVMHYRRDGSPFNVIASSMVVKGSEGKAAFYVVIVTDITEEKKLEEERQKNVRLESIGTLAGGIAHDFNNVLTGILGNIQLANTYLKQNKADTAKELLFEAEKASLRARDITQQLLTFSRGGVPVKRVIFIDRLIRESVIFALRGSRIKPEFTISDNLWAIEADEGQLNQVINNLAINADQAMPNGGIINVNASNTVIQKNNALPLPDGGYIEIAIKDHGIGIPKENKDRIFDPYFTTKQKGSGLGLATSYSIIKNHGGCITFESELGVGTTFRVYLPATKEKVKKEQEEVSTQPLPLTKGRILVMDDEDVIRALLSRVLKGAGYEVESTGEGSEAIQKYRQAKKSGKPFDAVILDLTVPGGMGGKEVIAKLLEIDPGVKAIVSSGYATDPIMADHKKYGFSGVVTKPYNISDMEKTLNSLIRQKK